MDNKKSLFHPPTTDEINAAFREITRKKKSPVPAVKPVAPAPKPLQKGVKK